MTDSLTASKKWCRYDDDFKERNGFRLPAGKASFGVYPSCLASPNLRHLAGASHPCLLTHLHDPSLDLMMRMLTPKY